jgi:hypothetical protein
VLDALYQDYKDQGLLLVIILSGGDAEMQKTWAGDYEFPVLLDDSNGTTQARWDLDFAVPSEHLIAPGTKLVVQDESVSTADIDAHLP